MANEFFAISDGTFTLSETEDKNQFYFYRNDGKILTDIDMEPMDMYHAYITQKMMNEEIADVVMNNICLETSNDGKCMRLTISGIGENPRKNNSAVSDKQPNFLKRLLYKIFG